MRFFIICNKSFPDYIIFLLKIPKKLVEKCYCTYWAISARALKFHRGDKKNFLLIK